MRSLKWLRSDFEAKRLKWLINIAIVHSSAKVKYVTRWRRRPRRAVAILSFARRRALFYEYTKIQNYTSPYALRMRDNTLSLGLHTDADPACPKTRVQGAPSLAACRRHANAWLASVEIQGDHAIHTLHAYDQSRVCSTGLSARFRDLLKLTCACVVAHKFPPTTSCKPNSAKFPRKKGHDEDFHFHGPGKGCIGRNIQTVREWPWCIHWQVVVALWVCADETKCWRRQQPSRLAVFVPLLQQELPLLRYSEL